MPLVVPLATDISVDLGCGRAMDQYMALGSSLGQMIRWPQVAGQAIQGSMSLALYHV